MDFALRKKQKQNQEEASKVLPQKLRMHKIFVSILIMNEPFL